MVLVSTIGAGAVVLAGIMVLVSTIGAGAAAFTEIGLVGIILAGEVVFMGIISTEIMDAVT
jgi:hypothetical protein